MNLKKILQLCFLIITIVTFSASFIKPVQALTIDDIFKAPSTKDSKEAGEQTGITGEESKYLPSGPKNPEDIIYNVIDYIFILAGILAVIFIIIAAIRMIANLGNEESVTSAKNMIYYAIGGLLAIVLSYALVTNIIRYLFIS